MNVNALTLIALFICHYLGDYVLTPNIVIYHKMTGKALGIAIHAVIHGALIFTVFSFISPSIAIIIAIVESTLHFLIDLSKSKMNKKWSDTRSRPYWAIYGLDQLIHEGTKILLAIIWSATI